jgi:NAD/NADP transhydrogenase alpha subunit
VRQRRRQEALLDRAPDLEVAFELEQLLAFRLVGALIAAGPAGGDISKVFGFLAIVLASVNIFGGFLVTNRMLAMFKKKQK